MATYTSNYAWTKPGGNDPVDISVLNGNLDSQDSIMHKAFANMAQAFSQLSTYAVGDIVLYDNDLYKCHTAVVTPGSWTGSTNWTSWTLAEGGGGTSDYIDLTNKPSINGITLTGNKTTSDLGITASGVGAIPSTDKGANGGVAELDSNGKVPSSQLPSYVDDVLSYASQSAFPATGETGKIYIAEDTNKTYRWSGSAYAEISASLALGETSSTAYRGDRGKTAYDHSQTTGNPHGTTKSDVGLGNVPNVSTNDQTPTFTEASTRNNIASGEKLSVIFGKIQKFFNDLKTVAFSGSYADLSNKPSIPTKTSDITNDSNFVSDANYVHTDNNFTTSEKTKLAGIASGAEANVQANWSQTNTSADDFIKNKPNLATVATSGSYTDLSNKPTIPAAQVNSDWNASSGVAEILNKPSSYTPSSHKHGNIQNGGTLQTTDVAIANGDKLVVTDSSNSAKIARTSVAFDGTTTTQALSKKGTFETFSKFSGSYADLTNQPQINGNTLTGNKTTSELGIDKTAVGLGNVPNVSTNDQTPTFTEASTRNNIASGEKLSVIMGKVQKFFNDLNTVAFSGSFSDLSNKPENANTFQGTIAEWNQLTTAQKKAYDHASIPDSIDGGVTFPANKVVMTGGGNVEDKLSGYIAIQNISPSDNLTWTHGQFVFFYDYKPSDTNYTWYLLNVMPASANIILCGIQTSEARALVHLSSGSGSLQASCKITWLGVKN